MRIKQLRMFNSNVNKKSICNSVAPRIFAVVVSVKENIR